MSARTWLVSVLLLCLSAPASAQTFTWTPDRPDAVAPLGVFGDRTLASGIGEIGIQYARLSQEGVRLGSELANVDDLFDLFDIVPFAGTTEAYMLRGALGLSDNLTVAARGSFLMRSRENLTQNLTYFVLESSGVSDIEAQALLDVYSVDAVRAHVHLGVSLPTGSVTATDGVDDVREEGTLPYDMQLGAGAFGVSPGLTAQIMNESGVVGGQVVGTFYFAEKQDWRLGDRLEGNVWASYRLNPHFSASARVHVLSFEGIQGFDPELDPARDPGEWPISYSGTRVDIPVGLNLYMPEGGPWEGNRLSVELVFPVHESFDGPWLATNWGASIGWQLGF
jgi:hypothetical protein